MAYALIPKDHHKGEFAEKAQKAVLIEYSTDKKAYKLLDIATEMEFNSQHVQFNKDHNAVINKPYLEQ